MSGNLERLGAVLAGRMQEIVRANRSLTAELGTIEQDKGLAPDSLRAAIPQGEYLADDRLRLVPGDRALVIWTGGEPVVVASVLAGEDPDRQPVEITDAEVAEIMGEEA